MTDDELKQQIQNLANSKEYHTLERQISESNPRFNDLSPKLKLVSLYLLHSGNDVLLTDLWRIFYARKIPTIEEFLTTKYIGDEARTLFPAWRKELTNFFNPTSTIYELVVSGAIGSGKTTFTNLGHEYNLLRLTSLHQPQLSLGAAPSDLLVLAMFTLTKQKAKLALASKILYFLRTCYFFEEVRKEKEFLYYEDSQTTPYVNEGDFIRFPNNIIINFGSTISHGLSFSLFGASLDEAEFRLGPIENAFKMYATLKERVRSRFLGSRFTMLTLMSSAQYKTGIIAKYTKNIKPNDLYSRYVAYPIWEVRSFDAYSKGHFYAMNGTSSHPSKILDQQETQEYLKRKFKAPTGCSIVKIPEAYRTDFETHIGNAMRNLAGLQTFSGDYLFDDTSNIERKNLIPVFRLEAPLKSERPLLDKLPKALFQNNPSGLFLRRYPMASRYLHLDMAETSQAGLALLHKELIELQRGKVTETRTIYVVDFACWIVSPNRISFEAVENLILDLHRVANVKFEVISTDQYQSSALRQKIDGAKIATTVKWVSVDKTSIPYLQLSQVIANRCLAIGKGSKLTDQLENIQLDEKKKIYTAERKDIADGVCGATHTAIMNTKDQPIYPYFDGKVSPPNYKKLLGGDSPPLEEV